MRGKIPTYQTGINTCSTDKRFLKEWVTLVCTTFKVLKTNFLLFTELNSTMTETEKKFDFLSNFPPF